MLNMLRVILVIHQGRNHLRPWGSKEKLETLSYFIVYVKRSFLTSSPFLDPINYQNSS